MPAGRQVGLMSEVSDVWSLKSEVQGLVSEVFGLRSVVCIF